MHSHYACRRSALAHTRHPCKEGGTHITHMLLVIIPGWQANVRADGTNKCTRRTAYSFHEISRADPRRRPGDEGSTHREA